MWFKVSRKAKPGYSNLFIGELEYSGFFILKKEECMS